MNADTVIGIKKSLNQHNLYAYCLNSPIIGCDKNGNSFILATLNNIKESVTNVVNKIKDVIRPIIAAVGAELQLIINRAKAKKVLSDINDKQMDYLVNVPNGLGGGGAIFTGVYDKYRWFYEQVNHGAPMDYKLKERRPLWAMGLDSFYFRGRLITFEEYGNINYGYVGKALGIPDFILYAGGGYAALSRTGDRGSIVYFFDSEADHNNISWGIEIYKEEWGNN